MRYVLTRCYGRACFRTRQSLCESGTSNENGRNQAVPSVRGPPTPRIALKDRDQLAFGGPNKPWPPRIVIIAESVQDYLCNARGRHRLFSGCWNHSCVQQASSRSGHVSWTHRSELRRTQRPPMWVGNAFCSFLGSAWPQGNSSWPKGNCLERLEGSQLTPARF
jgi:hypothetical protein